MAYQTSLDSLSILLQGFGICRQDGGCKRPKGGPRHESDQQMTPLGWHLHPKLIVRRRRQRRRRQRVAIVVLRPSLSALNSPLRCHERRHPREDLDMSLHPRPYVRGSPQPSSHAGVALICHIPPVVAVVVVLRGSGIEERSAIVQPSEVIRQVKQILARHDPHILGPQQRGQRRDCRTDNTDIRGRTLGVMLTSPLSRASPPPSSSSRTGTGRRMWRARGQNDLYDIARYKAQT